jgi:hypothetical protein
MSKNQSKLYWRPGSSGRVTVLQAQRPEFKLQSNNNNKKEVAQRESCQARNMKIYLRKAIHTTQLNYFNVKKIRYGLRDCDRGDETDQSNFAIYGNITRKPLSTINVC